MPTTDTTDTTRQLTTREGRGVWLLISLGFGVGNDYPPFDLERLRRDAVLTPAEVGAINAAIRGGLVERGTPEVGRYGGRTGLYVFRGPDGEWATDGEYRLTPAAVAAYEAWYVARGWRVLG